MIEPAIDDLRQVDAAQAHALILRGRYIYVDVRAQDEFEDGHPAGAVHVPWMSDPHGSFAERMKKLFSLDAKIIVGCQSGKRSQRAARELVDAGFTDVIDCRTGWDGSRGTFGELREPGWRRLGLPTESGLPKRS